MTTVSTPSLQTPPRLRPITAVAATVGLVAITDPLLMIGREPARRIWHHGPADWAARPWIFVGLAIIFQSLVALAAIAATRRLLPRFDPHLRWPPGPSYVGRAVVIGAAMGIIMLVADYWPLALAGSAPTDYPVDALNAAGWLWAMAITGLAEEPIFRGLLVGVLVLVLPKRVRFGLIDLPAAAYLVSFMFAAAHWRSFLHDPLAMAVAQQSYAVIWGLTYVWLMERSRSLLAPIIAHGVGDAVEVGLAMLWRLAAGV